MNLIAHVSAVPVAFIYTPLALVLIALTTTK
jgi:hypothetical protein